mgnify:CR=1 FL=1
MPRHPPWRLREPHIDDEDLRYLWMMSDVAYAGASEMAQIEGTPLGLLADIADIKTWISDTFGPLPQFFLTNVAYSLYGHMSDNSHLSENT